jgi:hypothetical protein
MTDIQVLTAALQKARAALAAASADESGLYDLGLAAMAAPSWGDEEKAALNAADALLAAVKEAIEEADDALGQVA